jgi:3-isopropylmalate/(R)-2-methylmalate dehydratase large subunit
VSLTATQKIVARACGRDSVAVGETVTVKVDLAMANDMTAPLAVKQFRAAGAKRVFDPDRICIVAGRHMPFRDEAFGKSVGGVGEFCREQGIKNFYANMEGMDHALIPDLGFIRPGMLVCNADSHTCTYGAMGAWGLPMGSTDIAYIFAFGETWVRVPETIRVRYSGKPSRYVTSKDYVLATEGLLGVDGARYKTIEFSGPALDALSVDERFTISNMGIEMGAKTSFMAPDVKTAEYLASRTKVPWQAVQSDSDAEFEQTVDIDVSKLEPVVSKPHSPDNVVPVSELRGIRVTQVCIGTCTNGRIIDMQQALEVLRGHKVANGVRLIVTPATNIIMREAEKLGLIDEFRALGATINPPGCGPCAGWHQGVLGEKDVCVATHNRNFPGRMGHPSAQIYLSSPYVAAATAIAGEIASPEAIPS